jgi:hypothetical protein
MSDKDISVFVDESGRFAPDSNSSRYYLICLVLHDQARRSVKRRGRYCDKCDWPIGKIGLSYSF